MTVSKSQNNKLLIMEEEIGKAIKEMTNGK